MKISVIVPVYNVEKYLPECIASLKAQTFSHFEVILVNDGSKDRSRDICITTVNEDARFVYVEQKNSGLSVARNVGLQKSKGKYIYFLDSDDWIMPNCLATLYDCAEQFDCDLVVHNTIKFEDGVGTKERKKLWSIKGNRLVGIDELSKDILIQPCWAHNKLYKKEFLIENELNFIPRLTYEDVPFFVACMLKAKRIYYCEEYLNNYRIARPGSITSVKSFKALDILKVAKYVDELIDKHCPASFFRENLQDWKKWNFAWMYTRLPKISHSIFMIWLSLQDKSLAREVLTVLGMRLDIIKVFCVPLIYIKYHNEKTTWLLFGVLPFWLRKRIS